MTSDSLWLARESARQRPVLILAASAQDAERLREELKMVEQEMKHRVRERLRHGHLAPLGLERIDEEVRGPHLERCQQRERGAEIVPGPEIKPPLLLLTAEAPLRVPLFSRIDPEFANAAPVSFSCMPGESVMLAALALAALLLRVIAPPATAMLPWITERFGNPSGAHQVARAARTAIDDARDVAAAALGVPPGGVIFTGGGTEADNLAILGVLAGRPGAVVCSATSVPPLSAAEIVRCSFSTTSFAVPAGASMPIQLSPRMSG